MVTMRRVIAEVGSCNGDLGYALDAVDQFADAGVWAIKGQLYHPDLLTSKTAPTYGKSSIVEKATQYEAFSGALSYNDWGKVNEACLERGVEFFGSVFDLAATATGYNQNWAAFKIASADITFRDLIVYTAGICYLQGAVLIVSTGAATVLEIAQAVGWCEAEGVTPVLLACTLSYPTQIEDANVLRMDTLAQMVDLVGYSDHTRGLTAADLAFRKGAWAVEKHVTLTPGEGGDHDFAITPNEVSTLVNGTVAFTEAGQSLAAGSPHIASQSTEITEPEQAARRLARRSWHADRILPAGRTLTDADIVALRPGTGIPVNRRIIGKRIKHAINKGDPIVDLDDD